MGRDELMTSNLRVFVIYALKDFYRYFLFAVGNSIRASVIINCDVQLVLRWIDPENC